MAPSCRFLLRHLNKAVGGQPLYRGGGSIGIIGAARIGLLVARDPDDESAAILAPVKVNIGRHPPALRYRLVEAPGTDVARVVWDNDPVTINAKGLLDAAAGGEEEQSALQEAADWLHGLLETGPRPAAEVIKEARRDGLAEVTVKRAKVRLKVESRREGFGPGSRVIWYRPDCPRGGTDDDPIQDQRPIPDQPQDNDPLWEHPQNHAEFETTIQDQTAIEGHLSDMTLYEADDQGWDGPSIEDVAGPTVPIGPPRGCVTPTRCVNGVRCWHAAQYGQCYGP